MNACGATNDINVMLREGEHVCVLTAPHAWHECVCHWNWIEPDPQNTQRIVR